MKSLMLETIEFGDFLKLDIRVGTILEASLNEKARRPAYVLRIDFGPELGEKISSAQITEHYQPAELKEKQVLAVVNFPPKRVAGVKSEVLVLAAVDETKGTILIAPDQPVAPGTRLL